MLQRLENAYLAILRFVVLLVAGLLLISVGVLGFNATKLLKQEPVAVKAEPKVPPESIVASITKRQSTTELGQQPSDSSQTSLSNTSPLDPYYAQGARAIEKFLLKVSGGQFQADHEKVILILKNRAKEVKEPEHHDEFVKGLAAALEKTLTNPAILKSASASEPTNTVNQVLDSYTSSFNAQIEEVNAKNASVQQQYVQEKTDGLQSLYYAAGAFGSFLMIIFLSIIIRIERNLRNLERLPREVQPEAASSHVAETNA